MAIQDAEVTAVVDPRPAPEIGALGRRGRAVRLLAAAAVAGLILAGSFVGRDDDFPFGPFTMYSGFFPPNGVITSTDITAQTADGQTVVVTQADTGIPRGDIEGELSAYEANPDRLGDLAAAYHRRHPLASPFVEMTLIQKRWQLHNRVLVSQKLVPLVSWHAP
jgi:hypothetical protein